MSKKILSYSLYEQAYLRRNPDKAPVYNAPDINLWSYLALLAILTGINLMSAAHTIPVLQQFFVVPPLVSSLVGVSGFLGIEGAILFLMARNRRGLWEYLVIILATVAAIVSNLFGTFEAIDKNILSQGVTTVSNEALTFVGVVVGLFVPLVNIAAGEVFHKLQIERSQQVEQANKDYAVELSTLRSKVEGQYKRYLKKMGITDLATQEAYLRGDVEEDLSSDDLSQVIADNPSESNQNFTSDVIISNNNSNLSKAEEVALQMQEMIDKGVNLSELTYDDLTTRFDTSRTTIAKAKKLVNA